MDDVNDSSLTIKWKTPETIGDSGLDGYTVEYCKDGSELLCACVCVAAPVPTLVSEGRETPSWIQAIYGRQHVAGLSLYLLRPLIALLVCSDDSRPPEITS